MTSRRKETWAPCRLGDVLTLVNGRAYKQPEMLSSGTPILRIQNLNGGSNWFYSDLNLPADKYCVDGDLLYAWSATFGPYIYSGQKAIFHYHIWNVRPSEAIDKQFAFYELMRITDDIKRAAHGVAMPHITKAGMEDWELNLPPLAEQKRIADKLDTMLSRVDACRDRLDRLPALLKRFRQSILAAAMSGALTDEWRQERSIDHWEPDTQLGEVGDVSGGLTKNAKRMELPLQRPYLRVANVYANELRLDDVATIGMTPAEFTKTRLQPNDLLIVEGNGSIDQIGRVAIWSGEIGDCSHQNHLIRWRAGSRLLPRFALLFLLSPKGRSQIIDVASSTTGLHTLSITKVSSIRIPVPTIDEQHEIVRRVDTLFAFADRLETRLAAARRQVGQLTPALLAKAFRGELVPQDPADEPASELLKRLAAQRAAAPAAKRGRKGARASAGA